MYMPDSVGENQCWLVNMILNFFIFNMSLSEGVADILSNSRKGEGN